MKKWSVALPISGVIYVEVEADNEDAAIEAALEADYSLDGMENWEAHRHIVQGNVCYAVHWSASAEEQPDEFA